MESGCSVYKVFIVLGFLHIVRFIESHTMHSKLQMGKELKEKNNIKCLSKMLDQCAAEELQCSRFDKVLELYWRIEHDSSKRDFFIWYLDDDDGEHCLTRLKSLLVQLILDMVTTMAIAYSHFHIHKNIQ